jgi:predicted membrane channel-forming protein YqfA (hemolysin III family)
MMRKDPAMRAFVIHLAIFVLVVSGLAAINLLRRPDHIWFIWVLAGWGIGVAGHDLALLLARTPRREAILTDPAVRGFFIHAFVFVAVNALLIVVNLIASPGFYWFYWPLLGWGIVLAAHGYLVFHRRSQAAQRPSPTLAKTEAKTGAKAGAKTKAKPGAKK